MEEESTSNGAAAPDGAAADTNGDAATAKTSETTTKVTAETYGRLDTSQVSNEVWMIRVPQKLADAWNEAPEGTDLGELVFTKGSNAKQQQQNGGGAGKQVKPSLEVHLSQEFADKQSDLPLKYNLEAMTKRVPVLHPFSRHADGSISLHGTVSRTANLQMQRGDGRYRQLCKNRLLQTSVNSSRYVRPVEATELSVRKTHTSALTGAAGFGSAVQHYGQRLSEAAEGGGDNSKKRKYEGQTTQSVIFELFEQQPFWSVKEMRSASGRPEKEIRDVLADVGKFHRAGEHKGLWELRKEFQKQDA